MISDKIVFVYQRQSPLVIPKVFLGKSAKSLQGALHHEKEKIPRIKHHKILIGLREKRDPEWAGTNKELEEKARAGQDEAFFQLLERNPEFLKTDLAMSRIMEWC